MQHYGSSGITQDLHSQLIYITSNTYPVIPRVQEPQQPKARPKGIAKGKAKRKAEGKAKREAMSKVNGKAKGKAKSKDSVGYGRGCICDILPGINVPERVLSP